MVQLKLGWLKLPVAPRLAQQLIAGATPRLPLPRVRTLFLLSALMLYVVGCQTLPLPNLVEEADVANSTADLVVARTLPLPPEEAAPPIAMQIADLNLTMEIVPMGWVVTEVNNQPLTKWIVPVDAVGWHVNSVGAGAAGNLILSGHQMMGSALFAPLALGDIVVGQAVVLTDAAGATFVYRVVEVSEPVPILGATEEDDALARSFLQPSDTGLLTMMTGWPDFTTTHRIFAVAELVTDAAAE